MFERGSIRTNVQQPHAVLISEQKKQIQVEIILIWDDTSQISMMLLTGRKIAVNPFQQENIVSRSWQNLCYC